MQRSEPACGECRDGRHRECTAPAYLATVTSSEEGASRSGGQEMKMCCDDAVCWSHIVRDAVEENGLAANEPSKIAPSITSRWRN